MKKLKLFIVLALLPAVLTACGKSDSEKAKDKANVVNAKLDRAGQLDVELNLGMSALADRIKIAGDKALTLDEVTALKAKAQEAITLYSEAMAMDDSSKEIRISNREQLRRQVASLIEKFEVLQGLEDKLKSSSDKPKEKYI